jgi:hypothetical protein
MRFTVRRLMVVVALAGLMMGGGVWGFRMWRLSGVCAAQAQSYKSRAFIFANLEEIRLGALDSDIDTSGYSWRRENRRRLEGWAARSGVEPARYARMAAHYAALVRKYERAARYPWLPLEPDPPQP